jgi:hypothetical protein
MGSILISRLVAIWSPAFDLARWRSDDLFKLVAELYSSPGSGGFTDAAGIASSLVVGVVLAFATYAAGSWVAIYLVGTRKGGRC